MIGDPPTFTTSCQRSHHFSPSYSINNDTASLQPVIADLSTRQKIICECCGRIGHKDDACIIRGPKFLSPSLIRKMNNVNAVRGDEPNEPPREWISRLNPVLGPHSCVDSLKTIRAKTQYTTRKFLTVRQLNRSRQIIM